MNIRVLLIALAVFFMSIATTIWYSSYTYYSAIHADDPIVPSLRVDAGSGKIIRWDLAIELSEGESYSLEWADIIETEKESKATILWPDRSITRLGADTRIVIEKMEVSRNYDSIQISYAIKRGKVWNTVIRLLVGDSYFDVHLPKENIVAGVRGTIFEVNLDNFYIYAVSHATHLTDSSGRALDLLPGELVSSDDISLKRWHEWLDTTWQEWNTASDAAYESLRALDLAGRIAVLRGESGKYLSLGGLTEQILSYFPGFDAITITRYIDTDNLEKLKNYSEETLLEYYQKASGISVPENRDTMRRVLLEKIESTQNFNPLQSLLQNASLWESIDTGKMLPSTEKYLEEKWVNIRDFRLKFENSVRNDTKKLLENLSGSLSDWIQ